MCSDSSNGPGREEKGRAFLIGVSGIGGGAWCPSSELRRSGPMGLSGSWDEMLLAELCRYAKSCCAAT